MRIIPPWTDCLEGETKKKRKNLESVSETFTVFFQDFGSKSRGCHRGSLLKPEHMLAALWTSVTIFIGMIRLPLVALKCTPGALLGWEAGRGESRAL